jgi:CRISPR-associated protein Cmr1
LRKQFKENENGFEIEVYFQIMQKAKNMTRIKIDITKSGNEKIVLPLNAKDVIHPYSDELNAGVRVYSFEEILAEKIRSLFQRIRPRDLYDVWYLWDKVNEKKVLDILPEKFKLKNVKMDIKDFESRKDDFRNAWESSLRHQLKELPDFEKVFSVILEKGEKMYIEMIKNKRETITFECETITPMFLGGADGRTPELRPPSIKGAMRFWWRAMHGHLPFEELKKKEAEIFGASDEKIGRSKFSIRITKKPTSKDIINSLWDEIPYDEKTSKSGKKYKISKRNYAGISYLLYSIHMLNERPYIKSGSLFSIRLSSNDVQSFKEAVHSFAFLSFLGALGTRNRRGAGSFMIKNVISNEDYKNLFYINKIQSEEQLKNYIESNLKPLLVNTDNRSYSILKNSKIYIFDSKNNWKDALEFIGRPFLDFRDKNQKRISETPKFGFPILHRNPNKLMGAGPKRFETNKKGEVVDFIERRASPLIFKVMKTNKDNYFPLIIWLNGELIPSEYKIMDKKGGNAKEPNEGIITEFLDTISNKLEVIL